MLNSLDISRATGINHFDKYVVMLTSHSAITIYIFTSILVFFIGIH